MLVASIALRLANITTLTSVYETPEDPSLNSVRWTNRSYQEESYGVVGIIAFVSPVEAQHVAVYSQNTAPLSLVEVVVYGE